MSNSHFSPMHILAATAIVAAFLAADLQACTAFIVKKGDQVLVGNNEDWIQTNVRVWFVPGSTGKHGAVFFGFADSPGEESREGGMNDEGLFFDGLAAPAINDSNPLNKSLYQDSVGFPDRALEQCASVEEVAALASNFHLPLHHAMWMFGDRYGNSIIIEGEKTVKGNGRYQICTNFRQSELQGNTPPCWRYRKADSLLQNLSELSVEYCRDILDAVHLRITQYSYILDLNLGQIHFYHFHDFTHVLQLNLAEELAKGPHYIDLLPRFPKKLGVTLLAEMGKAYFVSFSMIFFAVSLIVWTGRFLFRRVVYPQFAGSRVQSKPGATPGLIAGVLCALIGAYLAILLGYPEMIPRVNEIANDHSQLLRLILSAAPWLGIVLLGILIYFTWVIWKRRSWSLIGRVHYSLIALIALADVVIWVSWKIIP